MEMEQMMACPLAKMRINQGKTDANLKEIRANQELLKEEMLAKMGPNKKGWMPG
jgi:hypothetical protein